MNNQRPTPPLCHCWEPMELVRTIPHVEGVPEIFVFIERAVSTQKRRCRNARLEVFGQHQNGAANRDDRSSYVRSAFQS